MQIDSADLVRYNANNRGTRTGDCTARAISLAFNIDYSKARKALNDSAKEHRYWEYNSQGNCEKVIRELGGGDIIKTQTKIKVDNFVDLHSTGTYIIWCSKDGTVRRTNHLACIIDGKVYDSWDSRVYYVLGYWIIESGIKGSDIYDTRAYINTWFNEKFKPAEKAMAYVQGVFDTIINKNRKLKKLSSDNDIDISLTLNLYNMSLKSNYTFQVDYSIKVYIDKYVFNKTYPHKFSITFKPTQTQDEINPFFEETFYAKFYSFINSTIIYYINDLCEGHKLLTDSGMDLSETSQHNVYFYDNAEKRVFNNLPYWVRRLATTFYINRSVDVWGEHNQEITLVIEIPSFDTEYGNTSNTRRFEAEDVSILKKMLDYYKQTGDYEKACDIAYQY